MKLLAKFHLPFTRISTFILLALLIPYHAWLSAQDTLPQHLSEAYSAEPGYFRYIIHTDIPPMFFADLPVHAEIRLSKHFSAGGGIGFFRPREYDALSLFVPVIPTTWDKEVSYTLNEWATSYYLRTNYWFLESFYGYFLGCEYKMWNLPGCHVDQFALVLGNMIDEYELGRFMLGWSLGPGIAFDRDQNILHMIHTSGKPLNCYFLRFGLYMGIGY